MSKAGEIPGRYLDFLRIRPRRAADRGRPPQPRGRPLAGAAARPRRRRGSPTGPLVGGGPSGDLAGLARAFCPRAATRRSAGLHRRGRRVVRRRPSSSRPRKTTAGGCRTTPADFGGRRRRPPAMLVTPRMDSPWTEDRILVERARLLRRLGRFADAAEVWEAIGAGAGPLGAHRLDRGREAPRAPPPRSGRRRSRRRSGRAQ